MIVRKKLFIKFSFHSTNFFFILQILVILVIVSDRPLQGSSLSLMFESDNDYLNYEEHFEDERGEVRCSICQCEGLANLVEPVKTSCHHTFCW